MTAVAVVAHHERGGRGALAPSRRRRGSPSAATRRGSCPTTPPALGLDDLVSERPLAERRPRGLPRRRRHDAARRALLDGAPVPLLGVNVGVLGYLTEIEPPALTDGARALRRRARRRASGTSTSG